MKNNFKIQSTRYYNNFKALENYRNNENPKYIKIC